MFDAPHIDNISVNAASTVFHGLPEKGKHDQYHPMQLLQSIHDIHSQNRKLSQRIINKILAREKEPTGSQCVKIYKLLTCRERKQRWKVNGMHGKRLLVALDMILPDGHNLITHWAREMHFIGGNVGNDSQWMKLAAEHIMTMSMDEEIKIRLQFESELVLRNFEITLTHHAFVGEFGRRATFITLEMPQLVFDFMIVFWKEAMKVPKKIFQADRPLHVGLKK